MPNTSINCPNCRQRIVADVDQLFDVEPDPTAKQKLLSGAFNIIQCPHCGFNGNLATPIVYHDHEKELLLTYVPAEVNLPRDEQERVIGTIINQVVSQLPQEQRKGYLLQPQSFLNMQSMVERILEADGITHEMIEAQQQRLNLLQRLLDVSDDSLADVAEQEDDLLDAEFFLLLNSLLEASMLGNDQESAQRLGDLQQKLMPITTFGQQVQEQTKEVEAAVESLREAGEELTREKLLDLVITAPNETRLNALVSLARPGMDYEFFSMLSDRIDRARGDGRTRLIEL
ncbi:MAG: CpXC domain-containing protein, partial [Anaerolineales bacterium]|nr:CpXC domain-containing protein [Anaerolineales bacterium]